MQYKTLQQAIDDILVTLQDKQRDAHALVARIAIDALGEIGWTTLPVVLRREIEVEQNLTYRVPPDLIDVISVDQIGNNGTPCPLNRIKYIHRNLKKCSTTDVVTSDNAESVIFFWDDYIGEMYGYSQDFSYGSYYYNEHERRIEFTSDKTNAGDTLVLVYKTSNIDHMQIPEQYYQVLRHRVLMEMYEATNPSKSEFHRGRLQMFIKELKKSKRNHTIEDWINTIYGTYKSAAK